MLCVQTRRAQWLVGSGLTAEEATSRFYMRQSPLVVVHSYVAASGFLKLVNWKVFRYAPTQDFNWGISSVRGVIPVGGTLVLTIHVNATSTFNRHGVHFTVYVVKQQHQHLATLQDHGLRNCGKSELGINMCIFHAAAIVRCFLATEFIYIYLPTGGINAEPVLFSA